VTAFSRHAQALGPVPGQLRAINGDATDPAAVDRVVRGQQAVIVTLGISENTLRVRWLGSTGTPMGVRSQGTRNVITAMRQHGVGKLVVQTSYGVGRPATSFRRCIGWSSGWCCDPRSPTPNARSVRCAPAVWTG